MGDVIKDFNSILDILEADLSLTYQPLQSETLPDRVQQLRRAYFRTALTYIEAIVFQMKRFSLSNVDSRVSLTKGELAMLHEESYSLRQNGIVNVRPVYLPLLDNMKFTAEMFAKAHRSEFRMSYDDSGWGDLRQAQLIRNRITHPKNPTDLEIGDTEMDVLGRALARFRKWQNDVFDSIMG